MKLAIMQPYFMPYIGYFQTMAAVDKYVVYDDVQYIKGGWVSRNNLLISGERKMFTIILNGASPNKNFNEVYVGDNFVKFERLLQCNYAKAPFFNEIMPLLHDMFSCEDKQLAAFLANSYRRLFDYLDVNTDIILSSSIQKDNALKGRDKVVEICKILGANTYYNAIGGQSLYDKDDFAEQGIDLKFVKTHDFTYPQFKNDFVPNLSIIDVLMHNGKEGTKRLLNEYTLV